MSRKASNKRRRAAYLASLTAVKEHDPADMQPAPRTVTWPTILVDYTDHKEDPCPSKTKY
jgi:hypothetical protein